MIKYTVVLHARFSQIPRQTWTWAPLPQTPPYLASAAVGSRQDPVDVLAGPGEHGVDARAGAARRSRGHHADLEL